MKAIQSRYLQTRSTSETLCFRRPIQWIFLGFTLLNEIKLKPIRFYGIANNMLKTRKIGQAICQRKISIIM